ncbi:MAG: hypothetical protein QW733_01820 [Desulfurococcaceae archaeon]
MQELYGQFNQVLESVVKSIAQNILEDHIKDIRQELNIAEKLIKNLTVKTEDTQARQQIQELENHLTAMSKGVERLQDKLIEEIEQAKKTMQSVSAQIQEHEVRFETVKVAIEEGFKNVKTSLQGLTDNVYKDIQELHSRLKKVFEVLQEYGQNFEDITTAIREITERLKKKFGEFTDGINSAVENINRLWDKVESLQRQLTEERVLREDLQRAFTQKEGEIQKLTEENQILKQELERLKGEVIKQSERNANLEKENRELRGHIQTLQSQVERLYQLVGDAVSKLEELKEGYNKLKEESDRKDSKLEVVSREMANQRKKFSVFEQRIKEVDDILYVLMKHQQEQKQGKSHDILSP